MRLSPQRIIATRTPSAGTSSTAPTVRPSASQVLRASAMEATAMPMWSMRSIMVPALRPSSACVSRSGACYSFPGRVRHRAREQAVGDAVGIVALGEAALDLVLDAERLVRRRQHALLQDRLDAQAQELAAALLEAARLGEEGAVRLRLGQHLVDPLARAPPPS